MQPLITGSRPRRRALFAATVLLVGYAVFLVVACGASPLNLGGIGLQVAALAVVWWTSRPANLKGRARVVGYVASLILVFGRILVIEVHDWMWPQSCHAGGLAAGSPALVDWIWQGLIGLAVAALFWSVPVPGTRARPQWAGEPPRLWTVLFAAVAAWSVASVAATALAKLAHLTPWCREITGSGVDRHSIYLLDAVSGPQEEIVFTGVALMLLAGRRWPALCAAVIVSAAVRGLLHLYYADQQTVCMWLLWAALWSGGGLALAFRLSRRATLAGLDAPGFIIAYTAGTVIAHGLSDQSAGADWTLALLGVVVIRRFERLRHQFHWVFRARS